MGKGGLILLIVLVAILLFGLFALVLLPYFFGWNPVADAFATLGDLINVNVNVNNPPSGGGNDGGTTPPPSDGDHPTSIKPSSLAAFVSPNPVTMGGWVHGVVTADGNNYAITVYGTHRGEGSTQSFPGFLGDTATFTLDQQLNTPGYWRFYAELNADPSVKSNTVDLTCVGIRITPDSDHYSKTMSDSMHFRVFSYMTGNCQIIAWNSDHTVSVPITNTVINSGGFGEFAVNLDSLANGNWMFDVTMGGQSASLYGGECWIQIGR